MKNCPKCDVEHHKPGIFCSRKCANSKVWSIADKQKKSAALLGKISPNKGNRYSLSKEVLLNRSRLTKITNELKIASLPWEKLSRIGKRKRLLGEQNNKCSICGIPSIWNNRPLTLQLDHVNGNHADNSKENCRMICPNCHTQTDTFGSRNASAAGKLKMSEAGKKTINKLNGTGLRART